MPQFDPSTFTSQLFWLIVSFSILYLIVSKFGIPRLNDVLEQRQRVINDDLNYAESLNAEARQILEEYDKTIQEAKQQASNTIQIPSKKQPQNKRPLSRSK
jgi:F-type H+-transporting ATPase subunit b